MINGRAPRMERRVVFCFAYSLNISFRVGCEPSGPVVDEGPDSVGVKQSPDSETHSSFQAPAADDGEPRVETLH